MNERVACGGTSLVRHRVQIEGGDVALSMLRTDEQRFPRAEGRPTLLVHSVGAHAESWLPTLRRLAPRDVIVPDLRGHGRSAWTSGSYWLRDHARDLVDLVDRLGLDEVDLVAASMAGRLAVLAAAELGDRVNRLVLLDAAPEVSADAALRVREIRAGTGSEYSFADAERAAAFWAGQHPTWSREAVDVRARYLYRATWADRLVSRNDPQAELLFGPAALVERVPVWEALSRVRAAVDVVHAEDSYLLDERLARRVAGAVERGRYVPVPGGHYLCYEDHDRLAALLGDLLSWETRVLPRAAVSARPGAADAPERRSTTVTTREHVFIGGDWVSPVGRGTIEVENPATETMLGTIPVCAEPDVDDAVRAARAALPGWRRLEPAERAAYLRRLQQALHERLPLVVDTIIDELGAPRRIAQRIQAELPVSVLGHFADLAESHAFVEEIGNSRVYQDPVGVVAAITPWNYPLHQLVVKVGAALAAGCSLVAKPSEVTPFSTYLLFDAVADAGLPPGVINLVTGEGPTVGERLVAHPDVDMVSLTGSTRAGRRVSALAGPMLKRLSLELGGKSASLVLEDADLAAAVKVTLANAYLNSGQTCTAWSRMLVARSRYDEAIELAADLVHGFDLGDPHDERTRLGPLVSATQRERVLGFIDGAAADGARLVAGGSAPPEGRDRGYYVRPTVFADVAPRSALGQEEVFGPVLAVIPVDDDDHAVEVANDSAYGLAGAVWSADRERAIGVARRMETGSVDVNGGRYNPLAPFGGVKQSGIGREMGVYGLHEFLEPKAVQL